MDIGFIGIRSSLSRRDRARPSVEHEAISISDPGIGPKLVYERISSAAYSPFFSGCLVPTLSSGKAAFLHSPVAEASVVRRCGGIERKLQNHMVKPTRNDRQVVWAHRCMTFSAKDDDLLKAQAAKPLPWAEASDKLPGTPACRVFASVRGAIVE